MKVFADEGIELFCGDLRDWLVQRDRSPQFVFCDPPFNIGQGYANYNDSKDDIDFAADLCEWMVCVARVVDEGGCVAWHVPDAMARMVINAERHIGHLGLIPRDWIIWHYRFGQNSNKRPHWTDAKCHCLVYSKREAATFNADAVKVQSDRVAYGDKRVNDSVNGGMRIPGDVWGVPSDGQFWGRVQGNSAERVHGRPNQLPERYLERLIRAYTNEGDLVCDPFCGTGTTAVVSRALGRYFMGGDIDPEAIRVTVERLDRGAIRVCDSGKGSHVNTRHNQANGTPDVRRS